MNCPQCRRNCQPQFICHPCLQLHYVKPFDQLIKSFKHKGDELEPSLSQALSSISTNHFRQLNNCIIKHNHLSTLRLLVRNITSAKHKLDALKRRCSIMSSIFSRQKDCLSSLMTATRPSSLPKQETQSTALHRQNLFSLQRKYLSTVFNCAMFVSDGYSVSVIRQMVEFPSSDLSVLTTFCSLIRSVCKILFPLNCYHFQELFDVVNYLNQDVILLADAVYLFKIHVSKYSENITISQKVNTLDDMSIIMAEIAFILNEVRLWVLRDSLSDDMVQ
ncbi:hypothetical protein P9112_011986 [Eukaryota sp. TZLM1-RC]